MENTSRKSDLKVWMIFLNLFYELRELPGALPCRGQREKGTEMKIDTDIRHVTKPGSNLFVELGFVPAEAKRLQAASRKQIKDTQLLKQ